tara:strand:+ start:87 stop:779 length:693 start_codon:yes stop_codon:yes gene_type:complete
MFVSVIPARSGSKGIINKNIKELNGKPLIVWSIEQSIQCEGINETYVSTDSEEYSRIAKHYGAKIPFLRPIEISQDLSTDYEMMYHFVENVTLPPCNIVHLRPTYPYRSNVLITDCIKTFNDHYEDIDSLRTVIKNDKCPFKTYTIENKKLIPIFRTIYDIEEPYNKCRQMFPNTYVHNGCIDIIKSSTIYEKKSMTGDNIFPYEMFESNMDIDTNEDFEKVSINIKLKK